MPSPGRSALIYVLLGGAVGCVLMIMLGPVVKSARGNETILARPQNCSGCCASQREQIAILRQDILAVQQENGWQEEEVLRLNALLNEQRG